MKKYILLLSFLGASMAVLADQNNYNDIPPLVGKTSIKKAGQKWVEWFKNIFIYETEESCPNVVLSQELENRVDELTQSINNAVENDSIFSHGLFCGPPGTGKTTLAMSMAPKLGLEYIYVNASRLFKYPLEEAEKQLTHLFEFAKAYPKKLMVIIDDAYLLIHRNEEDTYYECIDRTGRLRNLMLRYINKEQSNFMVLALSDFQKSIDKEIMNCFKEKIEFGYPKEAERKALFKQYTQNCFIDSQNPDKRTFIQKFFSSAPHKLYPFSVASDVFTDETFDELACKSEGLTGRDIRNIMYMARNEAYTLPEVIITKRMLLDALEKLQQNHQEAFDVTKLRK